ncbi:MAG: DNA alkylation repair protein, partial [Myxococcota bacterium]
MPSVTSSSTAAQIAFVQEALRTAANPEKAAPMQAYMKTDMPFYGVPKPQRVTIQRAFRSRFLLTTFDEVRDLVEGLWALPHREDKYLALELALAHAQLAQIPQALPLWEQLVRDGAWWDLVDPVASTLVSPTILKYRAETQAWVERWIDDESLWVRRLALLSHLKHREQTDAELLFAHCLARAHERDFFIRKAIGWALREYSRHAPEAVHTLLVNHRERWSGLTFREA